MLGNPAARERFAEQFGRLLPTLVGEPEDAPANPDRTGRFEVLKDLHGFARIRVLRRS